jgi:hypothetical protein
VSNGDAIITTRGSAQEHRDRTGCVQTRNSPRDEVRSLGHRLSTRICWSLFAHPNSCLARARIVPVSSATSIIAQKHDER